MADKKTLTLKEVWALFREVREQIKELVASSKATDAQIKATGAQIKATGDQLKATDAQLKSLAASTDAKIDKVTSAINKTSENIGGLSKRWGDLGEAMTVGESLPLFNAIDGIAVNSLHPNVRAYYGGKEWEIDGIAVGKDVVIVIEAKATLKKDDIKTFINKKLKIFTKLEPTYEGKKIYGAMGFLSASSAVQELAQAQGLLLIRPTHTSKELVPPPKGFRLRNFHP